MQIINEQASEKGVFSFDYGVPTSPALMLAGQSPDKISTSSALKPFVLQLPIAAGTSGQTVGLDVSPAWLLTSPGQATYSDYVHGDWIYRTAFRTHLGLAVAQGINDSDPTKQEPSRLAFGFSTSLLDQSDPLLARLPGDTLVPGAAPQSTWLSCLYDAGPALQKQLDILPSPDKQRGQTVLHFQGLIRQNDALDQEQGALTDELKQIDVAEQRLNADRARFAGLRKGGKGAGADQAAIDELVSDKLAAIDAEIAQHEARRAAIKTRSAAITADVAAIKKERAIDSAALDKMTAASTTALQASFAKSEAAKLLPACVDKANTAARYAPDLEVGAGALWNGAPGRYAGYKQSGYVSWASYRQALGAPKLADPNDPNSITSYWMAGVSARASWRELLETQIKATPEVYANTVDVWLGLERISVDTRLSAQVGYQDRDPLAQLTSFQRSRFRYYASVTQRVGPKDGGVWLQLGYGDATETANDRMLTLSVLFAAPTASSIFGIK